MKLFAAILSFWLLFLSCLPCGDTVECNSAQPVTISAPADHENHKHETEHCTPFCTCSCCAISVIFQATAHYSYRFSKQVFTKKSYPAYNNPFYGEVSFAIWQPPKIVTDC